MRAAAGAIVVVVGGGVVVVVVVVVVSSRVGACDSREGGFTTYVVQVLGDEVHGPQILHTVVVVAAAAAAAAAAVLALPKRRDVFPQRDLLHASVANAELSWVRVVADADTRVGVLSEELLLAEPTQLVS